MELPSREILVVPSPSRLKEAIAHELAQDPPAADALAELVRSYALESYARLVPPERMLVSLKTIVAEAAPDVPVRQRVEFVASLIPFALEGYFLDPWVRRTGQMRRVPDSRRSQLMEPPATG